MGITRAGNEGLDFLPYEAKTCGLGQAWLLLRARTCSVSGRNLDLVLQPFDLYTSEAR
jgi:hypothetical protein